MATTWKTISPDLTRNDPATEAPSGGPIDIDQSGAEVYPVRFRHCRRVPAPTA